MRRRGPARGRSCSKLFPAVFADGGLKAGGQGGVAGGHGPQDGLTPAQSDLWRGGCGRLCARHRRRLGLAQAETVDQPGKLVGFLGQAVAGGRALLATLAAAR